MVKEIMAQLLRRPPLPVLCLGMLWRTELAGCAQRDSAEPVKQSGVRGDRDAAGLRFLYPCLNLGFAAGAWDRSCRRLLTSAAYNAERAVCIGSGHGPLPPSLGRCGKNRS